MKLPIYRFLNFIHTWALERVPADQREDWLMKLEAPLPWESNKAPTDAQLEREFEGWGALMASQGGN